MYDIDCINLLTNLAETDLYYGINIEATISKAYWQKTCNLLESAPNI